MEPVKEFYIDKGKIHERAYTVYYQEDEKASQTSGGTIIRVRQIHYDKIVDQFPAVGNRKPTN